MNKDAHYLLDTYNKLEVDNLYELATRLLDLLTDEEYMQICQTHKELLAPISRSGGNEYVRNKSVLQEIISLFLDVLDARCLTEDEFQGMTLDTVKQYIVNSLNNISEKTTSLYEVVRILEGIKC